MCYVTHLPGGTAWLIAPTLLCIAAGRGDAEPPAVESLASAVRPLLQLIPLKDIAAAVRYQFANNNALAFSFVSAHLKTREELRAQQERDRRAARRLVDLARATSPESGHRGRGEYVPH